MLIKFAEWIKLRESSPATRNKWNAAMGLQPMYSADVYGHGTPAPWIAKKLTKKLKQKKKKKHKNYKEWVEKNYSENLDESLSKYLAPVVLGSSLLFPSSGRTNDPESTSLIAKTQQKYIRDVDELKNDVDSTAKYLKLEILKEFDKAAHATVDSIWKKGLNKKIKKGEIPVESKIFIQENLAQHNLANEIEYQREKLNTFLEDHLDKIVLYHKLSKAYSKSELPKGINLSDLEKQTGVNINPILFSSIVLNKSISSELRFFDRIFGDKEAAIPHNISVKFHAYLSNYYEKISPNELESFDYSIASKTIKKDEATEQDKFNKKVRDAKEYLSKEEMMPNWEVGKIYADTLLRENTRLEELINGLIKLGVKIKKQ